MKKQFYILFLLAIFTTTSSVRVNAQFMPGEKGRYMFENSYFLIKNLDGGWLQLEGQPTSFRKSKLVLGDRAVASGYAMFLCFPKGNAYQIQVQFSDKKNTWGVLEIEKTLKKDDARVYLTRDDIKDENYIIHPQRFLIQEAPQGVFIRSTDGRYLRYDNEKKTVVLSSEDPANYKEHNMDKYFMWMVDQPVTF